MPKGGNGGGGTSGGGGGTSGGGGGGGTTLAITGIGDATRTPDSHSTDDRTLTLWGTSDPNTTVTIYADGTVIGTTTSDADGNWTYTTATLADGNYVFTAETGKGKNKILSDPYSVEIVGANTPPTAADDGVTTSEDTAVTVTVLSNDSDADNDTLSVTSVGAASNGSVTLNGDGTITYTPNANFFGADSFTYTISDGNGGTDTATVNVTVDPVNDGPTAVDDSMTLNEDTAATIAVLANDTDPENDALTVTILAQGANGTATVNPDGSIDYTPTANFNGDDSFTYQISDGNGGTSSATVDVTVNAVNDGPTAVADSASTSSGTPVDITVLSNDTDPDGDVLSVTAVGAASNGTVTLNGDGTVTYTPNANFSGQDSFIYTLSDSNGGEDTGTVTVNVSAGNTAPVAADDSVTTAEDTAVTVTVLSNDSDTDGDALSVTGVGAASNGSVTLNGDGTITYTPNANYSGADSFTYNISDGNGGIDTATVNVTVNPVNDGPTAALDSTSTTEDTPVAINVLTNDSDTEDDALTLVAVADPTHGSVTFAADGTITYTPDANWSGTDTVEYTVSDGTDTSTGLLTVTVDAVNDAPTAGDDAVTTDEDTPVTISVLANDTDVDDDTLTVTSVGAATNGTVTLNGDGTITYTPGANWSGTDSFTYNISDGNGGFSSATVTVTVDPVNDSPTAVDDSMTLNEDTAATIAALANDTDPENDALTVTILTQGANGTATVNPDGSIDYTPTANFNGVDTFTYQISDGNGGFSSATVTVTVNPVNDDPSAADDSATTDRDTAVILSVLANDTDLEGDTLSISAVTQGANGTVTINPDGTLTYNPGAGFTGVDSFTYTVSDGNGGTDTATVTVTVNEPAPEVASNPYDDPLYGDQWHLTMIGDIQTIWESFDGSNVTVGIYDNGVEHAHPDLQPNYDSGLHVTVGGQVLDPAPSGIVTAEHGTAVAGVIAAADNDIGGVGVAFGASITGVNIFGGPADINGADVSGFTEAMGQAWTFDIINNSWGTLPNFNNENDPALLAALAGFETAVLTGRGGLGTIVLKAAGNDWDSSQGDFLNASRYTITVAAHDQDGDASWYTNRGANVLVSAPSSGSSADGDAGILTTDETGTEGYAAGDYTYGFGGTSSATPVVSGVVALMLDANPDLGWRDVQSILAHSAIKIGNPVPGATAPVAADSDGDGVPDTTVEFPVEFFDWYDNAANTWNGGGLHFSEDYGFGGVDAYAAVRMAEVWLLFGDAQTSGNELSFDGTMQSPALAFDNQWVSASYTYTGPQIELEYVEVYVDFKAGGGLLDLYGNMEDVSIDIISPSGTIVSLMQASNGYDSTNNYLNPFPDLDSGGQVTWTYGINALRGETVTGDWTVRIVDISNDVLFDGGTLNQFQFTFYGAAATSDDIYHYTDEVFGILAAEPGRATLADGGGNDWLNMAAMTGDLTVDLATDGSGGASAALGGTFIDIEIDTQIENAVTGDGDDLLVGNNAGNELAGMRGDDQYWGLGGGDTFIFFAGGGQDLIWDFEVAGTAEVIELHGFSYSSFGDLTLVDLGASGTLVDLSLGDAAGDQITLAGVNYQSLGADDFVFV